MSDNSNTTINISVQAPAKSLALAIILAIFFGPLGLLYASVSGGLIMLLVDLGLVVASVLTLGMASPLLLLSEIVTIIWAVFAVQGRDKAVLTQIKQGNFDQAVRTATKSED